MRECTRLEEGANVNTGMRPPKKSDEVATKEKTEREK